MSGPLFPLFLGFITSFSLTYTVIPLIIRVAKERGFYDRPNERSSHREPTPSLGGIGIFAGTICGVVLWTPAGSFGLLQYILAAFVLIFLLGILDDLLPITPAKKLAGQILVAVILSYKAGITITSLYGIFGLYQLSETGSLLLTVITIVVIINAFNLIDGIDGLAGSVGFLSCLAFGFWFFLVGMTPLAVVALSLSGAVLAFLRYNFAPAKIFMGDTGSLLVGTVCAILAISFMETNSKLPPSNPYVFGAAPAIAVAVLILPLYDTFSVFFKRIVRGRSPFSPDKTHIHHQLLGLGLNHSSTTGVLISINLLFMGVAIGFNKHGFFWVLFLEALMAFLCSLILFALPRLHLGHKK